jgi:hypothetical protein
MPLRIIAKHRGHSGGSLTPRQQFNPPGVHSGWIGLHSLQIKFWNRWSVHRHHIRTMNLDLSDEETAALTQELADIVESDRYPFSPRIRTLRAILAKLRPEPAREPLPPPPKVYAPPRATAGRRRRG